ncbi:MAG TPA: MarR family transcriptional regulator [Nocardioidaceae bacterium]|nr:MarR family transcriptional regulator [Nocardioidaceae bacterium]
MDGLAPVGALVRRPAVAVRRRIINGLHAAGFTDLQPGHLTVLAWPGPDGVRPGVLAARADASKQAMNHLLGQLEALGYITRDADPTDRRTRIVRLTERGQAAYAELETVVQAVEKEWREVLGEDAYVSLRSALILLNEHFEEVPIPANHNHD